MVPLFRIREASLLVHHLDLLVDYLTGKPINRDMNPIVLLAFDLVYRRGPRRIRA